MRPMGSVKVDGVEVVAMRCATESADVRKPVAILLGDDGRVTAGTSGGVGTDGWIGTFSAKGGVLKAARQIAGELRAAASGHRARAGGES